MNILQLVRENNLEEISKTIRNLQTIEPDDYVKISSAIAVSIQYSHFEIFKFLLDILIPNNSFIDFKLRSSIQPANIFIYISVKYYNGNKDFLNYLIKNKSLPIPPIAIYLASKNNNLSLVKYLFDNGSSIPIRAIRVGAMLGYFDIVYFLIQKISSDSSRLPQEIITNIFSRGSIELIRYLLKNPLMASKINIRLLFEYGRLDIIKDLLYNHQFPIDHIKPYALREAYDNKHFELFEFLLKERFPLDITNDYIKELVLKLTNNGIMVNKVEYH